MKLEIEPARMHGNEACDETPKEFHGFAMSPAAVETLTGQQVHPEVFSIEPTGNLIHVLLEPLPKEYGHIILPDAGTQEKMGVGYIIAVGPMAGHPMYSVPGPSPIGVIRAAPIDLLGLHVIFGSHTGMPLRVTMLDREFRAMVLVMTTKDIRGVDINPKSLTVRAERRSKE